MFNGSAKPEVELHWGQRYVDTRTAVTHSGTYGYYFVNQIGTIGKVHSNNYSLWLQDTWDVSSRLTLNLGVRAENEYVPSYKDKDEFPDALDIKFELQGQDRAAPRLRLRHEGRRQVEGLRQLRLVLRHHQAGDAARRRSAATTGSTTTGRSTRPTTAASSAVKAAPAARARFIESVDFRHSSNQVDPGFEAYFNRPGMTGIDPNLKPVKQGEYTAGLEHELTRTMSVGVRYVHKWLFRTIEDVGVFFQGSEIYPDRESGRRPRGAAWSRACRRSSRRSRSASTTASSSA